MKVIFVGWNNSLQGFFLVRVFLMRVIFELEMIIDRNAAFEQHAIDSKHKMIFHRILNVIEYAYIGDK